MLKLPTNPPAGMRDFLASDMIKREAVINKIKIIFERFGFDPWETPAVEYFEVLQGKYGEEEKLIYKFKDLGGRELALRYDLTVPLARVVARFPQLPKPIKRYQISRVWRYERKQRGRYKEFWQCDVDIVGSKSMMADAEIIAITYEVLKELGFKEFKIRINNRKLLNGLIQYAGVEKEKVIEAFRAIDKLDKVGIEGVKKELKSRNIKTDSIKKILQIIGIKGKPNRVLSTVEKFVKNLKEGKEGIDELRQLISYLKLFDVDENYYVIDLSLVRGLDYYTGPIYETVVTKPKIGSLTGGGRYDKLIGLFTGTDIPATGTSIGIERIIDVMDELKMIKPRKSRTLVFVASVNDEMKRECIRVATELRRAGISCQVDLMNRNLQKQLEYADKLDIPYVIIVGKKELVKGKVKLKDMKKKEERELKIDEAIKVLKNTEEFQ
jgi:histidyl-tRNA synthetase